MPVDSGQLLFWNPKLVFAPRLIKNVVEKNTGFRNLTKVRMAIIVHPLTLVVLDFGCGGLEVVVLVVGVGR